MSLSNKDIETISVNAVRDSIVMSGYLDQFIADNDKEPSWDGHVYIYNKKEKKKANLIGRLAVQVKGKECDDHTKSKITFQMPIIDLNNYLYDGGIILFVVYIGNNGLTKKNYYTELTPVKLRMILDKAKCHTKKSVELKEFPTDNNSKSTIFLNCYQNCRKQASFFDAKLYTLSELEQKGVLEGISIPVSSVGTVDPQLALLKNEVYLYAKIKGSSILQPIELLPHSCYTMQEIEASITIDGREFYSKYKVIKSAKDITFKFGESFTISFKENQTDANVNYKGSSKLRVMTNDLDFALSYMEKGFFKINEIELPFDMKSVDDVNFNFEKQKQNLYNAKRIVAAFDMLGFTGDLDIKTLNAQDWRNIDRLVTAFVDKAPVSGFAKNLPPVGTLKVGNLNFILSFRPHKSMDGTYFLYDFFKTEMSLVYESKNGSKLPISQFFILHSDDFLSLSNMRFDVLLPSFQKSERHSETIPQANCFLLDLLLAYDKSGGQRKEILRTAHDFSDWILKSSEEELESQIKVLNHLQIIKREREFTIDEIKELYLLIENENTREDSLVGAYLLLEQQVAAEIHFAKLSCCQREEFKNYPIYHFWKGKDS